MKYTRKLRGGQNNQTNRRNRVRAMMMKPYANAAAIANAQMGNSNDPAGMKNMGKGFSTGMQTMRNTVGQKLRNAGQTLKNKYSTWRTNAILENNFAYKPNVAGTNFSTNRVTAKAPPSRGYGSRNLLKQANMQHKYVENRKRRIREAEEERQRERERERKRNSLAYTKATVARNVGSFFF